MQYCESDRGTFVPSEYAEDQRHQSGSAQLVAAITSAYIQPEAVNTRLIVVSLSLLSRPELWFKMVGVPRSSGCHLCVTRRVKVRGIDLIRSDLVF